MPNYPSYKLYDFTGITLIYTFTYVVDDGSGSPFFDPTSFVEHTSTRGQGSHVSLGDLEPFDIPITFILKGEDYEDLAAQMESLISTIEFGTRYILKVEKEIGGDTIDVKCRRLESFSFPLDRKKKRVNLQTVNLILRAESWG